MELPTNADKYNENQTIYEYITEQATGVQSFVFFCRLLAVDIRIFKVYIKKKKQIQGFPVGSVDKNVPVNAGDMGSVPGPGRFHMQGSD